MTWAAKRPFGPCWLACFVTLALLMLTGHSTTANTGSAPPDPVLEWMRITNDTALAPPATNPLVTSRNVALVSAAVFDSVNGIEPRYQPFFVKPNAPHAASARAAAVQAAYALESRGAKPLPMPFGRGGRPMATPLPLLPLSASSVSRVCPRPLAYGAPPRPATRLARGRNSPP